MANLSKSRVKVASNQLTPIDLSHNVITTQDFGNTKVLTAFDVVPGDKFNINLSAFVRCAPLAVPTYGNINIINRAFFVPYRLLMDGFEDFLTGESRYNSINLLGVPTVTFIRNNDIVTALIQNDIDNPFTILVDEGVPSPEEGPECDFYYYNGTDYDGYNFTTYGRRIYDMLISLGYGINFTPVDTTTMSAFPLLALMKIYRDYLVPSQFRSQINKVFEKYFKHTSGTLGVQGLKDSFAVLQNVYDPDYFTSCWPNTNKSNKSTNDNISLTTYVSNSYDINTVNSTSQTNANASNASSLSTYVLNSIQKLSAWATRNNLAGSRWFEQSLVRFGIRPSDSRVDRAEYLGKSVVPIQISDVMSTAGTSDNSLGDYAGKGIGYNNGSFKYDSTEYGIIIITSQVIPQIGYYQGRKRHTLHLNRFDFFTPEFDMLGNVPVRNDELFASYLDGKTYDHGQNYGGSPSGIFGFNPRYSEYKFQNDVVSGDFRINHLNTGLESYHLMREIPIPQANSPLACTPEFSLMTDAQQYDRIFSYVGTEENAEEVDHFYSIYRVHCTAFRPMHSICDHFDIEGEGHSIEVPTNGIQIN